MSVRKTSSSPTVSSSMRDSRISFALEWSELGCAGVVVS